MKKILFAFLVLFLASCNEPKVVSPTDYYEVTFYSKWKESKFTVSMMMEDMCI